jgi:transmembrane sensor
MSAHTRIGFFRWGRSAAAWFARLKAEPITPKLDGKYKRWLAAHPANEVAFERHELAWELAGELAKDDEIAALLAEAQLVANRPPKRERQPRRLYLMSAVAATLAVMAIGTGVYLRLQSQTLQYTTSIGELRTVVLPDQSRMVLNTATRVRVIYSRGERRVELDQGEATFLVAQDSSRPFEVNAAKGTTRALGTEFNVLSSGNEAATVSVLSGRVEVITRRRNGDDAAVRSVQLTPGQEVTYTGERLSAVTAGSGDRIQAWHAGRVSFEDAPLSQVLTEFNRYTEVPIVVRDSSLAGLRVTGLFRIGETDALLRALGSAFGVRAENGGAEIELYGPNAETEASK